MSVDFESMELERGEAFLIAVTRAFSFLRDFSVDSFSIYGPQPAVTLQNWQFGQALTIFDDGQPNAIIERKGRLFGPRRAQFAVADVSEQFGFSKDELSDVDGMARVVKRCLLPVLNSNLWIDSPKEQIEAFYTKPPTDMEIKMAELNRQFGSKITYEPPEVLPNGKTRYQLLWTEKFVIEAMRQFDFLRGIGYEGRSFSSGGREWYINYERKKPWRRITIIVVGPLHVALSKSGWTQRSRGFSIESVCPQFGYRPAQLFDLSAYAAFMKKHLMPVLEGRVWIDKNGRLPE
jgi:hypothetical protein